MPLTSDRNRTPSSTGLTSFTSDRHGTTDVSQRLQGHAASVIVTDLVVTGDSRLPLSSTARLMTPVVPSTPGLQVKLQLSRPTARCHVVPPSTETSTALTTPPPLSAAVPVMLTDDSAGMLAPFAGDVMTDAGGVTSVLGV